MRGDRPFTHMAQKQQGTHARNFAVLHEQLGEVNGRPTGDDYHRATVEECIEATIRAMPQTELDWDVRHPADCGCRVCKYRRGEEVWAYEGHDDFWKAAADDVLTPGSA